MISEPCNLEIVEHADGSELTVKVVPGASRTKVAGAWGTALRVTVSAAPESGRANAAVVRLLAEVFSVKRGNVCIVAGQSRMVKRVRVAGRTAKEMRDALARRLTTAGGDSPTE